MKTGTIRAKDFGPHPWEFYGESSEENKKWQLVSDSLDRAIEETAQRLDPSIESIEVKRKQEETELKPGMVLESPEGRRCVLLRDCGDDDTSYTLVSLDFTFPEDIGPEWSRSDEIRELLANGWKLLPGSVEYVETGASSSQIGDGANTSTRSVDKSDGPAPAEDDSMPKLKPGMWAVFEDDDSRWEGAVRAVSCERIECWDRGGMPLFSRHKDLVKVRGTKGELLWQRRPS